MRRNDLPHIGRTIRHARLQVLITAKAWMAGLRPPRRLERVYGRRMEPSCQRAGMGWALALAAILVSAPAWASDPAPLKPGTGQELTATVCNICHTSNYIIMNSTFMPPAMWATEVAKMRHAFGAPMDDETQAAITAYLSAHYAVAAKP